MKRTCSDIIEICTVVSRKYIKKARNNMKKQRLISVRITVSLIVSLFTVMASTVYAAPAGGEAVEPVKSLILTQGTSSDDWSGITAGNGAEGNKYLHIAGLKGGADGFWVYAPTISGQTYVMEFKIRVNAKEFSDRELSQAKYGGYRIGATDGWAPGQIVYFPEAWAENDEWTGVSYEFSASGSNTHIKIFGSDYVFNSNMAKLPFDIDDINVYVKGDVNKENILLSGNSDGAYGFDNGVKPEGSLLCEANSTESLTIEEERVYSTADKTVNSTVVADYEKKMTLLAGEYTVSGKFRISEYQTKRILATLDEAGNRAFNYEYANGNVTPFALLKDYNVINLGVSLLDEEGNAILPTGTAKAELSGNWTTLSYKFTVDSKTTVDKISFVGSDGVDLVIDTQPDYDGLSWATDALQKEIWYRPEFGIPVLKYYMEMPQDGNSPYIYTYSDFQSNPNLLADAMTGKTIPAAIPFDMDDVTFTTDNGGISIVEEELDVGTEIPITDGGLSDKWTGVTAYNGDRSNTFMHVSETRKTTDGYVFTVPTVGGETYTFEFKLRTNANIGDTMQYRVLGKDSGGYVLNNRFIYEYDEAEAGWQTCSFTFTTNGDTDSTEIIFRGSDMAATACVPFDIDDIIIYKNSDANKTNLITGETGVCGFDDAEIPEPILAFGYAKLSAEEETYFLTAHTAGADSCSASYSAGIALQPGEYSITGKYRVSDYLTKRLVAIPDGYSFNNNPYIDKITIDLYELYTYADFNKFDLGISMRITTEEGSEMIKAYPIDGKTVGGEWVTLIYKFTLLEESTINSIDFKSLNGVNLVPSTDDQNVTAGEQELLYRYNGDESNRYVYDICIAKVVAEDGLVYRDYEFSARYPGSFEKFMENRTTSAAISFDIDDVKITFVDHLKERVGSFDVGVLMMLLKKQQKINEGDTANTVWDDGKFEVGEILTLTNGTGKSGWKGISAKNGDADNSYLRVKNVIGNTDGIIITVPTEPGTQYNLQFDFRNNSAFDNGMQYRLIANDSNGNRIIQDYFNYKYNAENGGRMTVGSFGFVAETAKTEIILCGSDYTPCSCVPFDVDNVIIYKSGDVHKVNILSADGKPCTFDKTGVPEQFRARNGNEVLGIADGTYYATASKGDDSGVTATYKAGFALEPGKYVVKGKFRVSEVSADRMVAIYSWGPHSTVIDDWNTYNVYRDYNKLNLAVTVRTTDGDILAVAEGEASFIGEWVNLTYTFDIEKETQVSDILLKAGGGMTVVPNTSNASMLANERNLWYGASFGINILKCGNEDGTMMSIDAIKEYKSELFDEIMVGKTVPTAVPFDMDDVELMRVK